MSSRFRRSLLPPLLAALTLGGCASLAPDPLTLPEIAAISVADRQQAQKDVEPVQGALTQEEAIARAIKYNLDRRTRLMEEALAHRQLEAGRYDMLPRLVASAGYRERDKDLITRSRDSVTGEPSLANPFISSERAATTTDLSFTWSLLDFGQSYFASRQNADRALIAAKCAVAAPFAGRVAEQRVREQQYVQPGQPLLEILDDSVLELEFIVPSKWLVWLKPNQGFQVAIDETGKSYPAKVQRIGARVDPVSQSIKLSAVIDGKFGELIAGMSGKVLMTPPAGQ